MANVSRGVRPKVDETALRPAAARRRLAALAAALATLAAACSPPAPVPATPRQPAGGPADGVGLRVYLWLEDRCLAEVGPPCLWSDDLVPAAETLAEALARDGTTAIADQEFVRSELARAGVGHPNAMVAGLSYSGGLPTDADLAAFVSNIGWRFPAREFAVGHVDGAIVVVGLERLVEIEPPPWWLPQAAAVTFGGRLLPGWSAPQAFVSDPSGAVREVAVRTETGGGFGGALPIGPVSGRYIFEVMAERGTAGPAIVYLLPIELSLTPPESLRPAPATGGSTTTDPAVAGDVMAALVDGFRTERGLPPLERSADLDAVAALHAADMTTNGFFGHVSPTRGDLADRLRAARIAAPRAAENLAMGPSAESAFASLLESPAHRANFLDPQVSRLGVSCAADGGSLVCAVVMTAGW